MRVAVLAAILCASPIASADAKPPDRCVRPIDVAGRASFRRYPAFVRSVAHPAVPSMKTAAARQYRTVLRQQAINGPNFAGHYAIVVIGCGAGASCYAIVDAISGRVFFPPNLRGVADWSLFSPVEPLGRLVHRRDSRLLIAFGLPNEDEGRAGASLYEWVDGRLLLRRFVPLAMLCSSRPRETLGAVLPASPRNPLRQDARRERLP